MNCKHLFLAVLSLIVTFLPLSSQEKYRITELVGCESIRIGGRYVSVGAVFIDTDRIEWNNDEQILRAQKINGESSDVATFTRESMARRLTLKDYFLHKQAGASRSAEILHSKVSDEYSQKRIALVIGNGNYLYQPNLPNAVTDAIAVSDALLAKGFDVILELDGDASQLYQDIESLLVKVKEYGQGCVTLFYYAGHGVQVERVDYIVPFDSKLDNALKIRSGECFPVNNITEEFQKLPSMQNLVLIDACRIRLNDETPDRNDSFIVPDTDYGTSILYSTRSGEKASDGKGSLSPFATAFIEGIDLPNKTWSEISSYIVESVREHTTPIQTGVSFGTPNSRFIFNPVRESHTGEASPIPLTGKINGYDYVDLGLPSGLLWAKYNVGASLPSETGQYFAWGETAPKEVYEWANLRYCEDGKGNSFSKYGRSQNYGGEICLSSGDDVASVNWGKGWRMPTSAEWQELRDRCVWTWTSQKGINGYKVTSKANGQSIFLPASGWRGGHLLSGVGEFGYYWSSTLHAEKIFSAYGCDFGAAGVNARDWSGRFDGQSVRPVADSR